MSDQPTTDNDADGSSAPNEQEPDVTIQQAHDLVEHNLTNHAPANDGVVRQFEAVRAAGKDLGHAIVDQCPDSREKSLALTNLEQAVMWAVAAIARNQ